MNKRRLLWHLYPPFLAITVVSLIAVSWFSTSSLRDFYIRNAAADLEARAHLLAPQVLDGPADRIDAFCKKAGRSSGTRITVIRADGVVIGDSEEDPARMDNHGARLEIIQAAQKGVGRAVRHSSTLNQDMLYVAVAGSGKAPAFVRTSLPITAIDRQIRTIQIQIALGGLLILLLAAGVSLAISRRIARPVEQMKQGAMLFADGHLEHRLAMDGAEELSALADSMNRMAAQLDDRIRTIDRQRNELETVLSSMAEAVVAIDMDERIVSSNRAAAEMFGKEILRTPGRTIQETVRNTDLQRFIHRSLENREDLEEDIRLHSGKEERTLYTRSTPLRDSGGRQIGILIVMSDVTRLRRLENLRRDFVANVSHELKTPLTAIKGFVETLQHGGVEDPNETERFLGIIARHVERLSAIIEDLLKLSRIEREDEGRLQLRDCRIRGVLLSALGICRNIAEEKRIRLELDCDESLSARIDPSLIEQAAVNLLDNAVKYSDADRSVKVAARREGSEVVVSFTDQGIGIESRHLPRLFERFYRVDKARSRRMGGTGLGLSIVKHLVRVNGGQVAVESVPGKGSTFEIRVPAAGAA